MPRRLLMTLACLATATTAVAQTPTPPPPEPQKVLRVKAAVPDGMARLSETLTGSYFAAAPLTMKYDELLARLDALKRDIDANRISGPDALKGMNELRTSLKELREQLDKSKVMVPAVHAHTRTESVSFDIGPERTVRISAQRVRLVGTDGDKIVCTLEKIYLGGDAKDADAELAKIAVVHRCEPNKAVNEWTPQKLDADAAAFAKTPAGQKLTPEQRARERRQNDHTRALMERDRDFRGKAFDEISIGGLDTREDSVIEITSMSKGGGGIIRTTRRRHATLTVAVPKCRRVAVYGARLALEVAGLQGSLTVTESGNRDHEFDGQFTIRGVRGDVDVMGYPFSAIEDITGSLTVVAAQDSGSSLGAVLPYLEGWQSSSRSRPGQCAIKNVGGDLRARVGRADIHVEDVRGAIAVENVAGNTKVVVKTPLAAGVPHRLTSVNGTIEIAFGPQGLGELELIAGTTYGTFRYNLLGGNAPRFFNIDDTDVSRSVEGFYRDTPKVRAETLVPGNNFVEALRPENTSPGLVISTVTGHIAVAVTDK